MAGAPAQDDDDLIRDEDYVPDPNSQPPSAGAHINARVHGIGPVVWLLSLTYLLAMVVAHHMRLFCMIASELNQTTRSVVFVQMCAWFRSLSRNGSAFLRAGPRVGFVPTRTLQLPPCYLLPHCPVPASDYTPVLIEVFVQGAAYLDNDLRRGFSNRKKNTARTCYNIGTREGSSFVGSNLVQ
ncbi:uncharacterized protein EDB91DRAFT_1083927 [Suillus paluster]|uniref:uncharacterized protein n=1 Tax=Suillus paluster TaxID=48578 RepID=UPI001B866A48|nr:uncharacterized protein EDB91DRAFT_1083927 [Suillus paluster]KAG1734921.1 hypothetical protein EDB91DRAFT_1083927 [Suillus paluster]